MFKAIERAIVSAMLGIPVFLATRMAESEVLFQDNFDGGSTANWTQYDGSFSLVNGAYQIQSTAFANDARTVAGSASWTDYSIEMDYKITNQGLASPPTAPSEWPCCVLFRVADIASGLNKGHYYQLSIGPIRYEINYVYGLPNQISTLGSATVSDIPINTWHHLTLNVVGETATAHIDGKQVLTTRLATQDPHAPRGSSAGAIGLKAINSSTVHFDNIRVSSLREVVPAARLKTAPLFDEVTQKLLDDAIAKLKPAQAKQVTQLNEKFKREEGELSLHQVQLTDEMKLEVLKVMVVPSAPTSKTSEAASDVLKAIDDALKASEKDTDPTSAEAQRKKAILTKIDKDNFWDQETRNLQADIILAAPEEKRRQLIEIYLTYAPRFEAQRQREAEQREHYKKDLLEIVAPDNR